MIEVCEHKINAVGKVSIGIRNVHTGLEEWIHRPNLITTVGLQVFRDVWLNIGRQPTGIGVGTDNTAPAVGDTDLGAEVWRIEINRRVKGGSGIRALLQGLLDTGEANGNTLVEAGLFNSTLVGGGELISRVTHNSIAKTSSIQLTYKWEYTISAG